MVVVAVFHGRSLPCLRRVAGALATSFCGTARENDNGPNRVGEICLPIVPFYRCRSVLISVQKIYPTGPPIRYLCPTAVLRGVGFCPKRRCMNKIDRVRARSSWDLSSAHAWYQVRHTEAPIDKLAAITGILNARNKTCFVA